MEILTLKEKFGLNSDRYSLDPLNPGVVAFNDLWARDLYRRVSRLIVTGVAPKLIFIHKRGDGKTHISNWIAKKIKIVKKIYVECPALTRGSSYIILHRAIMSKMFDLEIIDDLLEKAWDEAAGAQLAEKTQMKLKIESVLSDKDLTSAFYARKSNEIDESTFYKYLRGEKVKIPDLFEPVDSNRAIEILKIFANLYQKYYNKFFFIVIDEVDNITEARQGARDFKEAFRKLAEIPNIGLIFICNLSPDDDVTPDSLPSPLKDRGVQTRIGMKNILVAPTPMGVPDVEELILKANEQLHTSKTKKIIKDLKHKYKSDLNDNLFPFSKSGFTEFVSSISDYIEKTDEPLLPRSVLNFANECLGEALLNHDDIVDSKVVKAVGEFSQ